MTYPASFDTPAELYTAVNSWATPLVADITASATSIAVATVSGLPSSGLVAIDGEIIYYAGILTGVLTGCVRGRDGTVAAAHTAGTLVEARIVAAHHNKLSEAVRLLQAILGIEPAADVLNSIAFTDVADRLARTLPLVVPMAASTSWSYTHDRGRMVQVQVWVPGVLPAYQLAAAPAVSQDPTSGQVMVTFGSATSGFLVIA